MPRKKVPGQLSEDNLQKWCITYAQTVHPKLLIIHIPNGGSRHLYEATKLKAMGVRAGVLDLLFILPESRVFWCEMKVPGGKVSKNQEDFMTELDRRAHDYAVCWTQEEFMALCKRLASAIS